MAEINEMEISEAELKEDNGEERVQEDFKKLSFSNFFNGDSVIKTFYQDFPTQSNVLAACKEANRNAITNFVDGLAGIENSKKVLDSTLLKSCLIVLVKHCAGVWDRPSAHKWFDDYVASKELHKTIADAFGIFDLRSFNDILKLPVAEQMAVLEQHTTAISSLNCAKTSDHLADFMSKRRDSIPRPLLDWRTKQLSKARNLLMRIIRFYQFLISDFEDMGSFVESIYKGNGNIDKQSSALLLNKKKQEKLNGVDEGVITRNKTNEMLFAANCSSSQETEMEVDEPEERAPDDDAPPRNEYPTSSDIVSRVVLPGSREAVLAESATCRKYLDHYYENELEGVRASVVILAETTLPFVGTLVTLEPRSRVEGLPKDAIWISENMFATASINSDIFPELELDCPCFSVWNFCIQTDDIKKADVKIEVSEDNQITVRFLRDRCIGDDVVMWNPARRRVVANLNNDKLILARELVKEIVNANNEIANQLTSKDLEVFNDGFVKRDVSRVSAAFEFESWPIIGEIIRTYIYPYNTVQQAILDIYKTVEGTFICPKSFGFGTPRSYAFFSMWRRHLLFASVRRRFSFTTAKSERLIYWRYATLYTKCHVAMFRSNVFLINLSEPAFFAHYGPDSEYLMRRDSPKEAVPRATSSKRKTSNGDAEDDDYVEDDPKNKNNGAKRNKVVKINTVPDKTVAANGSAANPIDIRQSGASGDTATVVSGPVGLSLVAEMDSELISDMNKTNQKARESYMNKTAEAGHKYRVEN
jgi:hypothetical protein